MMEGILEGKYGSPGLAEQMGLTKVKRLAQVLDLRNKARHLPQGGVIWLVRTPRSQLIVADYPEVRYDQLHEWPEILRVAAGSAMEKKERTGARAHAFIPDTPAWDLHISLYA